MGFERMQKIPSADEIIRQMPLGDELRRIKRRKDEEILELFKRTSNKFLVIIGPCSADDEEAVCEYAGRLAALQPKVREELILVPRIYTNKPRTSGAGYKGMVHQPNPQEEPNIVEGIQAIRRLHLRVLRETGLTAADEMLYPGNYPYLADLLSYVAIGARSVENQEHRLTVSGLDIPAGMKNPTSGDVTVMLNSVQAAQLPHVFSYNGYEVRTSGNPFAHGILRGAVNQYGQSVPNYHYENLTRLAERYLQRKLSYPTVIVDTNHANSDKQFGQQPRIAREVMHSIGASPVLKEMVRGLMIESYLVEGAQDMKGNIFGRSITDPCLGWDDSERLVLELAEMVARMN